MSRKHKRLYLVLLAALGLGVVTSAVPAPNTTNYEACFKWTTARADMSEPLWDNSGDPSQASGPYCDTGLVNDPEPGSISAADRDRILEVLNVYRWLAGYENDSLLDGFWPDGMRELRWGFRSNFDSDDTRNESAQLCAYMLAVNSGILFGHQNYRFLEWEGVNSYQYQPKCDTAGNGVEVTHDNYQCRCYSASADEATFMGHISSSDRGIHIADQVMLDLDFSNIGAPLGHRRIHLSELYGPVGIGFAPNTTTGRSYTCAHVRAPQSTEERTWIAYPGSRSHVPLEAFYPVGRAPHCDDTPYFGEGEENHCEFMNLDWSGWSFFSGVTCVGGTCTSDIDFDPDEDGSDDIVVDIREWTSSGWASPGDQRPVEVLSQLVLGENEMVAGQTLRFGPARPLLNCVDYDHDGQFEEAKGECGEGPAIADVPGLPDWGVEAGKFYWVRIYFEGGTTPDHAYVFKVIDTSDCNQYL